MNSSTATKPLEEKLCVFVYQTGDRLVTKAALAAFQRWKVFEKKKFPKWKIPIELNGN